MNDEHWMGVAINEVEGAKRPKQVGAVIVRNGKVLASAHSLVYEMNDPTQHAEMVAIQKAAAALKSRKLDDCIIYSTCEPCMMCSGAILWARIPEVVYGMKREDWLEAFEHSNRWHRSIHDIAPALKIRGGVLREQCLKVFAADAVIK